MQGTYGVIAVWGCGIKGTLREAKKVIIMRGSDAQTQAKRFDSMKF